MREPSSSSSSSSFSSSFASKGPRAVPPPPGPSALELLRLLLTDIPRMISERVQLFALEVKRARQALIVIVALVAVAAVLLLTAWFVLWGSLVAALIAVGLAWGWAVLIVLLVNLGGAVAALLYAASLGRFLALPATMRHLTIAIHDPGKAHETPFTTGTAGNSAAPSTFAPGTGPAVGPASKGPTP